MLEGGCRCGACRYTVALDVPPPVYACHCHQCQRWSGSAFSLQALVREDRISVTGPVAVREVETEDRTSVQRLCDQCGARLYNTNTRRPGLAVIRAGTLDHSEELACRAHIWTLHKQAWLTLPDDVSQWSGAPDIPAFMAVLTG